MSSHSTAPTAMNIKTKFRPKNTTNMMTKKMNTVRSTLMPESFAALEEGVLKS